VTGFLCETIAAIIPVPLARVVGAFYHLLRVDSSDSFNIFFFALSGVAYIFTLFVNFLGRIFLAQSIYVENRGTFSLNPIVHLFVTASSPTLLILDCFFEFYPTWARFIPRAIHVLVMGFSVWEVFLYPFISISATCILMGLSLTSGVSSIVRLFTMIFPEINQDAYFFAILAFLVLSSLGFYFLLDHQRQRIVIDLAYDGRQNVIDRDYKWSEGTLTEDEKDERLARLNLTEDAAILYLYVGLDGCCDLVLDFSLVRYIVNRFSSTSALIHCLRFLVYFPSETSRLDNLLNRLKGMRDISVSESYFI
jgi:hypothetical protein